MGGPGSGRYRRLSRNLCVEHCRAIDVRLWHRQGMLIDGRYCPAWWVRNGNTEGRLTVKVYDEFVHLHFGQPEGWRNTVTAKVRLTYTPCTFGGYRPWFQCPGCVRRVALLYEVDMKLRCRHCHRLVYKSELESDRNRLLRKARRIRRRLGVDNPNLLLPSPSKPKHMHWQTFERLKEQEQAILIAAAGMFMEGLRG